MAVYRPGRLRRILGNGTMWNFSMYSPALSAYDGDIQTVTIRRGKSGRGGGVHPATMEITVNGAPVLGLAGSNVYLLDRVIKKRTNDETEDPAEIERLERMKLKQIGLASINRQTYMEMVYLSARLPYEQRLKLESVSCK